MPKSDRPAERASADDALPFEQLMGRLESIVARLESGELSLEDALAAYQEGVGLARSGQERLASAERRIEELARGGQLSVVDEGALVDDDEAQ